MTLIAFLMEIFLDYENGRICYVVAFLFVQEMIRDAIEDSITWPVRKIVPILPGDYR